MHAVIVFTNLQDHSLKPEIYGPFDDYQSANEAKYNLQVINDNAVVLTMKFKYYHKLDTEDRAYRINQDKQLMQQVYKQYVAAKKAAKNVPLV